jgi:hypothetical protein
LKQQIFHDELAASGPKHYTINFSDDYLSDGE